MATGADIIAKVRYQLQDTDDESFDGDHILDWINLGAQEFAATTGCIHEITNIATDATNYIFALSTNLTNPHVLYAVHFNGTPLTRAYLHEISTQYGGSSGTPTVNTGWFEFEDSLYLEVIPPTATGSSALNVFYVRTPTDMTATSSTFDFPDKWTHAIVEFATAKAFESQRDSVLAAQHMARYDAVRQTAWAINKAKLLGTAA
jgi:hypothetical protein